MQDEQLEEFVAGVGALSVSDIISLDEDDLKPLGDVVYFGGSRMHSLQEVVPTNE